MARYISAQILNDLTDSLVGRHADDPVEEKRDKPLGRTVSLRSLDAMGIHIPVTHPATKFPSTPHLFDASKWYPRADGGSPLGAGDTLLKDPEAPFVAALFDFILFCCPDVPYARR